jgi:hypothetical protein
LPTQYWYGPVGFTVFCFEVGAVLLYEMTKKSLYVRGNTCNIEFRVSFATLNVILKNLSVGGYLDLFRVCVIPSGQFDDTARTAR